MRACFGEILVLAVLINCSVTSVGSSSYDSFFSFEDENSNTVDKYHRPWIPKILERYQYSSLNKRYYDTSLGGRRFAKIKETSTTESSVTENPRDNSLPSEIMRKRIKEYVGLSPPMEGKTFQGLTIQCIAAGVPGDYGLVIEIVNFLVSNLTHHRLFLDAGLKHMRAPSTIPSKTREVLAFKPKLETLPSGIMKYQIGDTGFSLHLYFWTSKGRIAVGFLENSASVKTLSPVDLGCSNYNHNGTVSSFRCIEAYEAWNSNKTVIIHQDTIYAKLTGYSQKHTFISKVELFKLSN